MKFFHLLSFVLVFHHLNGQTLIIQLDTFKVEDCGATDSNFSHPISNDHEEWMNRCNYFQIEWPSVQEKTNLAHNKIELQLRNYICSLIQSDQIDSVEFTATMSEAFILKHNKNTSAEWSITCSMFPSYSFIHQFQVSHGGYYYGAAHGFGYSRYFHFNDITGKEIGMEQLFEPNELTLLTNFTLKKLQQEMNHEWDESISSDFFLTENFLLTAEGISFFYDAYEIGPYAMGYPEISLTWLEIEHCLSMK